MFISALVLLFINAYFAKEHTNCVCEAERRNFAINCSNVQVLQRALTFLKNNSCATNCAVDGCKRNYFIIQSHHDHCLHSEVPIEIETDIHDFEEFCEECDIKRKYDPALPACNLKPNCTSSSLLIDAVVTLASNNCSFACTSMMACGPAFRILRSFHDICPEDAIPQLAEELLHFYEDSCEDMDCNTGFPNDVLQCSSAESLFSSSMMIVLFLIPIASFYL